MDTFNSHNTPLDCSVLENLFLEKGMLKSFNKNDYFLRQGDKDRYVGYVATGFFRLSRIDSKGNEWMIGYSFEHDFVCDYPAMMQNKEASVNIQASTGCTVYLLSFREMNDFWETDMNTQRLGRNMAETMFSEIAQRLYSFYDTPEQRYITLMQRCPRLQERLTLKEIASFIGVTPETVSRIRKNLLYK